MVGVRGVEAPLTQERKPGDIYGSRISTTVYNTPSHTPIGELSTTSYLRRVPQNIKERTLLCT